MAKSRTWKEISLSELVASSARGDTRLGEKMVVSGSPGGIAIEDTSAGGSFLGT